MKKKFFDVFTIWGIFGAFITIVLLYYTSTLAMHYIWGKVALIFLVLLFILSIAVKNNIIKVKKSNKFQGIILAASLLAVICAIASHINIVAQPFIFYYEKVEDGVKI